MSAQNFRLNWAPQSNASASIVFVITSCWGSRWCSTAGRGGRATAPSRRPPLAAGRAPPLTAAAAVAAADVAVVDVAEMAAGMGIPNTTSS